MSIFDEYKGFWGTGAELSERAKFLSKTMGFKAEKLTERLIRYYTAEGVLDKPDRLGRDAAYHFRHLIQLLTARRLANEGVALAAISTFNLNKSTEELERALLKPSKEEALVVSEMYRENFLEAKEIAETNQSSIGQHEVIYEMKLLRESIIREREDLEKTQNEIFETLKRIDESQSLFFERMKYERNELTHIMSTLAEMADSMEKRNRDFVEQIFMLNKQMELGHEEIRNLVNKQHEQHLFPK